MGFHVFGRVSAPTVMLLHGAYTTWELSFGAVIPLLAERFRVIAYGTSGFDPTESTEFSNARAEAERICHYTRVELDGHLTAIYASSLGCHPATYAALDPRTTVGTVILDGPVYMNTGRLTPITSRLERPTARLLASPRAQSVLQRLRGQPDPQSKSANLIYTEASVRSFENTAWSNVAWSNSQDLWMGWFRRRPRWGAGWARVRGVGLSRSVRRRGPGRPGGVR